MTILTRFSSQEPLSGVERMAIEHRFPIADWHFEVTHDELLVGYDDWLQREIESWSGGGKEPYFCLDSGGEVLVRGDKAFARRVEGNRVHTFGATVLDFKPGEDGFLVQVWDMADDKAFDCAASQVTFTCGPDYYCHEGRRVYPEPLLGRAASTPVLKRFSAQEALTTPERAAIERRFSTGDWKCAVLNNDTRLGYVEWLEYQIEAGSAGVEPYFMVDGAGVAIFRGDPVNASPLKVGRFDEFIGLVVGFKPNIGGYLIRVQNQDSEEVFECGADQLRFWYA